MATIAELVTKFKADTSNFSAGVNKVKGETKGLGDTTGKTTSGLKGLNLATLGSAASMLGLAAGIGAVIAVSKKAIAIFAEFQQTMANVQAVTKATGLEMFELEQAAKQAGENTRFTATQAADALFYLASAGLNATEAAEALEGALLLAGATGSELSSTAETLTAILSQYNLESTEGSRVANVFAAANANSQATMAKLSGAFRQVGPVAAGLNITLEETTGALQVLFNAGFRGEQAGRALKSALADLANESSQANAKLQALGVSFDSVNPEAVGLEESIRVLERAGLSTAETLDIFGKVAGPQLSVLISKGADELERYTEAVTGTNEAAEQYAIQNDTLKGDMDLLNSATQSVAIEFGEGLEPALRNFIKIITNMVKFLQPLIEIIADLAGVGLTLATGAFRIMTEGLRHIGNGISWLLDLFEKWRVGIFETLKSFDFLNRALEFAIGLFRRNADEVDNATESMDDYNEVQNRVVDTSKAWVHIQQEMNAFLAERIALEEEAAKAEAERIAVFVNAREQAEERLRAAEHEANVRLRLGQITREEYNEAMIAANNELIDSLIEVGYNGLEDNIGGAAFRNALNRIDEIQSANKEYLGTIEDVSKGLEDEAIHRAKRIRQLELEADAEREAAEEAEALKQVYLDIAVSVPGQISSVLTAIDSLRNAQVQATIQALDAEAAARIEAGENELAVKADVEKRKAEIEYKAALASWRLNLLIAIASGAQMILNGFKTQPFIPAGLIAGGIATTLAGLQVATVAKSKPVKNFQTGTQGFRVPEGFPDDSFQVGLTSGERLTVETPNQQASGGDGVVQNITILMPDGVIFKTVNRGIADRMIRLTA